MANHVPRLGRRSLSPFNSKQRNGFRFFGGVGDGGASGEPARNRNLAGFFGPLFNRTKTSDITADDQARNWPEVS